MGFNKNVLGYNLNELKETCLGEPFNRVCRKAGSEGAVLLKNDNGVLPLNKGTKVALFGRIQNNYYKSGTGSGGLVRTDHIVTIPDGLKKSGLKLNEKLRSVYEKWEKENPVDVGAFSFNEPWARDEMPLDAEFVYEIEKESEAAIVIIGRTAGEAADNANIRGSYLLGDVEEDMLKKVTQAFKKVIVLLNVGNTINMGWVEKYDPSAVMYIWQGGQEGGDAVADLIVGNVTPSGKLTDTIAKNYEDCPYYSHFGDENKNTYVEDIYVGYRYFNTFAKDKICYPFGFGLSYTSFNLYDFKSTIDENNITVTLKVKNTGNYSGKEVVQVYYSAPQGVLGKPLTQLAAFKKTSLLKPEEIEELSISFSIDEMASYDDTGATGNKNCYVLEKGNYNIFVGTNSLVHNYNFIYRITDTKIVRACHSAMAPLEQIERYKPIITKSGVVLSKEEVKRSEKSDNIKIPYEITYTGDKGIKLQDVKNGKNSIEEFVAQFSDEMLTAISIGEGMNSPKVTGGTACAFGGVTKELIEMGVPIACGTDGPSGIRMDSGMVATSMPSGTLLSCTWNTELVEELYTYEGVEMSAYKIDAILGPGINIHRHPLNGRNFEYFSEDPFLTGEIAKSICKGVAKSGNTATIKHFCGNNQEFGRNAVDTVISERALREIYLKPFEIVIKSGECKAIMTAYNMVNGCFCASNYDLNTTILREEWDFKGFVMTDWWAKTQIDFDTNIAPLNLKIMAEAQNDIYMVRSSASNYDEHNILDSLKKGELNRGFLQRNAINICSYLMDSNAMDRFIANGGIDPVVSLEDLENAEKIFEVNSINAGEEYYFDSKKYGRYLIKVEFSSQDENWLQNSLFIFSNDMYKATFTTAGTEGRLVTEVRETELAEGKNVIKINSTSDKLVAQRLCIYKRKG